MSEASDVPREAVATPVARADGYVGEHGTRDLQDRNVNVIWATQNSMEPDLAVFDPDQLCQAERRAAAETRELLVKSRYAPHELVEEVEREASEIERALKVASRLVEHRSQNNLKLEKKCDTTETDCKQIRELIQMLEARFADFGGSTAAAMQDCLSRYEQDILDLENDLEEGEREKSRLCDEIDEVISEREDAFEEIQMLESKRGQWYDLLQLLEYETEKKASAQLKELQVQQQQPGPVLLPENASSTGTSRPHAQLTRNASAGTLQVKELGSSSTVSSTRPSGVEAAAAKLHHDLDDMLSQFAGSTADWRHHILGAVKRHLGEVDSLTAGKMQPVIPVQPKTASTAVGATGAPTKAAGPQAGVTSSSAEVRRPGDPPINFFELAAVGASAPIMGTTGTPSMVATGSSEVIGYRGQLPGQQPSWSAPIIRGRGAGSSHGTVPVSQTVMPVGSPSSHHPVMQGGYHQSWPGRTTGGMHHSLSTGPPTHGHSHVSVVSPRPQAQYSGHAIRGSH